MRLSAILLAPILAITLLALQGCAHHQPSFAEGSVIRISGNAAKGLAPGDAFRQMLGRAARATVDHGYRYFSLVNASPSTPRLQPGAALDIRMLPDKARMQKGVLDAYLLLEGSNR